MEYYMNKPTVYLDAIFTLEGVPKESEFSKFVKQQGRLYLDETQHKCGFFCFQSTSAFMTSKVEQTVEYVDDEGETVGIAVYTQNSIYVFML